jgi:WD40 repeat protein
VDTGRAVGEPWKGHTRAVRSIAYSPDGHHIVSGSDDNTIRIWDVDTGRAVGGSDDKTIRIWDAESPIQTRDHQLVEDQQQVDLSSTGPHPNALFISGLKISLIPDSHGWIHHPDGGLLFWVPEDCRNGLASPAILTIPTNGHQRVVRLDFTDFQYGTSWHRVKTTNQ